LGKLWHWLGTILGAVPVGTYTWSCPSWNLNLALESTLGTGVETTGTGVYTWHWTGDWELSHWRLHLALAWRLLALESTLGTGFETIGTGDYTWH